MEDRASAASTPVEPAPAERGWGKLLIAIVAFLLIPNIPQVRSLLPIEQTMVLFIPALAACTLVGWWAGGRAFLAIAWMAVAALLTARSATPPSAFSNLVRGWTLLLAGSFGLVCLFAPKRPFFPRALVALGTTLLLATVICLVGPVSVSQATKTVAEEFARRNAETMSAFATLIQSSPKEWAEVTTKMPWLKELPAETERNLGVLSGWGTAVFPALLSLESLAALALVWATYHRLARARLGPPLRPVREFRFNDQLVWGLIVGLTIMLLPTLQTLHGVGKNLLIFFGALYALRGFGVLSWFMAPGSLGIALAVGFVLLLAPVLNVFVALAFLMLAAASLALGLGDTWADWRSRARSTS